MLIHVATPFSTGTGIYLSDYDLIVTNEHVVRSNRSVVVEGEGMEEHLAPVVYLDSYYDLAFLRAVERPSDGVVLADHAARVGDRVVLVDEREVTGEITAVNVAQHGIDYLQHSAWSADFRPGSPLLDESGRLTGINMLAGEEAGEVLALPVVALRQVLEDFSKGRGQGAARCFNCREITFEVAENPRGYCPSCGKALVLPSLIVEATPSGIAATVEDILRAADYDPRLARRGPDLWRIRKGSATIQVTYHEDSGLVTGDAYLCRLPEQPSADLFAFLLRENEDLRQLTFSTHGEDIILSLLIYDRYLSVDTALPRFQALFAQADDYDDVLVETYGGRWR